MLTRYIRAALEKAVYDIIEDDGSCYGHIPRIEGVWANAPSLEACRDEPAKALEECLLLSIAGHSPLPGR